MEQEKTDEDAWEETISYLDDKQKEKRIKGLRRGRKIHAFVYGLAWLILVIGYFYFGLKNGIDVLSFLLIGFLLIFAGLFVVLRVYFVGLIWSPFLYLLDIYIRQKFGKPETKWSTQEKIDFLWFSVILGGIIGSVLLNMIFSAIGFYVEEPNYLMLIVWNIYLLTLIYYATSKSIKLKKSG